MDETSGGEESRIHAGGANVVEAQPIPDNGAVPAAVLEAGDGNLPMRADWRGYVAGSAASVVVVAVCLVIMASWQAGASGDVLLIAALLGLLLLLPHTIPVWAGLTLLACTAAALIVGTQPMAETFADLAYYGISVGCLWGIWNEAASHFGWRMPLLLVVRRLVGPSVRSSTDVGQQPDSQAPPRSLASAGIQGE